MFYKNYVLHGGDGRNFQKEGQPMRKMTQKAINEYTQMAFKTLENLSVSEENKQVLIEFGESLMYRTV